MITDAEQAAIKAVIDKAVAAGMDRGRLTWDIEKAMNMQPVRLPLPDTPLTFGMTVTWEVQASAWPPGTPPEQMQAAEDYVRSRIRRYWGWE